MKNIASLLLMLLLISSCDSFLKKSDREKSDEYYASFAKDSHKRHERHRMSQPEDATNKQHNALAVKVEERKEKRSIKEEPEVRKGGIDIDDLKDNQQAGGNNVPKEDEVQDNQQAGGNNVPKEDEVQDNAIVEVPATYPGGEHALVKFLADNLVYPSIAQEQDLQGRVTLRFKVEKDGSIGEVRIVKGLSKECDAEAVRVVRKLKRFTPARQQGHPVAIWFTLPIRFQLQ